MSTHRKEEDLRDRPPLAFTGELQEAHRRHLLRESKNNSLSLLFPCHKDHLHLEDPPLHQDPRVDDHHDPLHAVVTNPSNENEEENQMHSPTSHSIVSFANNYISI